MLERPIWSENLFLLIWIEIELLLLNCSTIEALWFINSFLGVKNLDNSGDDFVEVTSFFSLNLIWNQGIAFGLFSLDQGLY